jgi:radical SAM protein with 4Fe4S-binding SPASM domain
LHPDFFVFAKYAVNAGIDTSLSTNITLLDEDKGRKVIESGIHFVILALDGISKETYEKIRVGGQFEKNLQQVKGFLRLKKELRSRIYVEIQFILMEENKQEMVDIADLFTQDERKEINMFRIKPIYTSPSINTERIIHRHPCYFLWNTLTLAWDGRVPLCCMDYNADVVIGDIREDSVINIWNNKSMIELRRLHRGLEYDKLKICNNCSLPEKDYFSHLTILANAVLSSSMTRRLLPLFERNRIIKR